MTQGERDTSGGELSSFLHLTGYRPLVLALLAGIAGAVGVFLALQEPPQFQARYVLNAGRVIDNEATAAELDLAVEELVSTASFPEVLDAVEEETGLVFEDDYEIVINRAGGALINVNVVADDPTDAQNVAVETGIAAVTFSTERQVAGIEASRDQLLAEINEIEARMGELTIEAGVNPIVALENAETTLLSATAAIRNPPREPQIQPDGTFEEEIVEYEGPPLEELEAEVERLTPIASEFGTLQTESAALNDRLANRNNTIREARSAITLMESERETPLVITEVITEETSKIAGLLTGLLIFAVPATLIVILFFTLLDLVRRKPEPVSEPEEFDPHGEIEPARQRALPESTTRLTVVDEDERNRNNDVLAHEDTSIIDVVAKEEQAEFEDDDDEPPTKKKKKSKRSKDGRWGRDASSKAG